MKAAVLGALLGVFLAALFVAWCSILTGCGPSPTAKEAAAEGAYGAEHLRCVDKFNTKAEIDACRAAVRVRWGVTDAGADR